MTLTLVEGENSIRAAAQNRAGESPLSSAVIVTLDTTIPPSPTNVTAEAKARAHAEQQAESEAQARAKAEQRAQAAEKVRAEAEEKAGVEARARAEAQKRAEMEAKARARAETKARAEVRARSEAQDKLVAIKVDEAAGGKRRPVSATSS